MKIDYHEYLKSDYWAEAARLVKKRAGFRCQVCNSVRGIVAHHRTYEHLGKELDHLDDLTCLCGDCHKLFHDLRPIDGVIRATKMPNKEVPTPPPPAPPPSKEKPLTKKQRRRMKRLREKIEPVDLSVARKEVKSLYDHEVDMPTERPIILTKPMINKFYTKVGGITSRTIAALGIEFPLEKGWSRRLCGKEITEDQCRRALEGRECLSTYRTMRRAEKNREESAVSK